MTYLELCQALAQRAGISGTIASVQGQTGEALRVVNWIAEAYEAIQNEHDEWEFLRADVSFSTTTSNNIYTPVAAGVTGFASWRWRGNDWRSYLAATGSIGEMPVDYVNYGQFRQVYAYGANRSAAGRPVVITERPDQSLEFWPIPSDVYTIVGECFLVPQVMVNNDDTPVFPARYHMAIVYRALMLYGEYEGDTAVFTFGQAQATEKLAELEDKFLPKWEASRPMA